MVRTMWGMVDVAVVWQSLAVQGGFVCSKCVGFARAGHELSHR